MTPDEIRKQLRDRNLGIVSRDAGVAYGALVRFARGQTKNPSYNMVIRLERYLSGAKG